MQTTATKTANRTSPYQTRSKTATDMMDENELLHAQLARLELRVKYPVIYRKDLDDPGRHGEGAMDAVFAGDVDYPVIMRIAKWHDGRLAEQTEVLPDCVSDEIAVLAPHLTYYAADTEKAEVCKFAGAALSVMTTSKALKAFLSNGHIWRLLPLTREYESSQIEIHCPSGPWYYTWYINHQPAPPYYTHDQF
jgi:hypothetical protein